MSKQSTVRDLGVVPTNMIRCFITGKLRKLTPEERVRQDVARSLVEEYGYEKENIEIELPIKMGRAKKRADIAVFLSGKTHDQESIYMIVEAKRESIRPSDKIGGVDQLGSYVAACPNTLFALWVGNEKLAYRVEEKKGERKIIRIPDIPSAGETTIPRPTTSSLVPAINLKQVFRRTHNYIYANQGFQKDKAFEELQKMIFIKVFDEQYNPTLQFFVLPGESVSIVRKRLAGVFDNVQKSYKHIFKGDEKIELNDAVLRYIVSELQRFSLVDTETDVKGEAYEEIVGPNLRGDRGEFFTPRNVCMMTMNMLFSLYPEDSITSPGALRILDPAVGTGGFLIAGVQKLKSIFSDRGYEHDKLRDLVRDIVDVNFFGIDFNPFLVKVAQMNMVMHGDGSSNIVHANSLEHPSSWNEEARRTVEMGGFDIVVTNPPFGTNALIDNPDILNQFELTTFGARTPRSALPPERIFIERCLDFLKPGGYLGIVLPDSILSNPGLRWLREWILMKSYIMASIDLPGETFEPHTGTQTSVLILKKPKTKGIPQEDYDVFMAIPKKVGHDRRGSPLFMRASDGKIKVGQDGRQIIDDHLPIVAESFRKWVRGKGII